ncbi:MAG: polysulfide reductase NrfD [Deltaproteobacteria bacterium]|nr:polysulfide reductase NrfD [Deltaproteobacteria bacterium]
MSIIRFAIDFVKYVLTGGIRYYVWLGILGILIVPWAYGAYQQLIAHGMIVAGFTDQISWAIYEGNFIFLVGVAAAAVTVVFPYYVYKYKPLKDVVLIGEMLAITAVIMVIIFIVFHMGRPDRAWHMIPVIGIFNWPNSMLAWDVLVIYGYLFLNFVCGFYNMHQTYTGRPINEMFYKTFIYIAIMWAPSIHIVTAFLLNTMPARPMWFHSIMPIKFLSTAFAAGPALIIATLLIIRKRTDLKIPDEAINFLSQVMLWCLGIAIILTFSEVVTELYPSTEHADQLKYALFGLHGMTKIVPWLWASWIIMICSFLLLLIPGIRKNYNILPVICVVMFIGIWIEKGIALVIPGMVPSPIGEIAEYSPTWIEIFITIGNWAIGLAIFTFLVKGAIGVMTGEVRHPNFDNRNASQGGH